VGGAARGLRPFNSVTVLSANSTPTAEEESTPMDDATPASAPAPSIPPLSEGLGQLKATMTRYRGSTPHWVSDLVMYNLAMDVREQAEAVLASLQPRSVARPTRTLVRRSNLPATLHTLRRMKVSTTSRRRAPG